MANATPEDGSDAKRLPIFIRQERRHKDALGQMANATPENGPDAKRLPILIRQERRHKDALGQMANATPDFSAKSEGTKMHWAVGKSFRLDGEEWEVTEADASSGLVKYARLCEGDTEQEISLEELEEVTLNEASALRARESVEATALEVDALVRQDDVAVAVVEYRERGSCCAAHPEYLGEERGVGAITRCEVHVGARSLPAMSCCTGVLAGSTPHRAPAVLALMKHRVACDW
jgi:hypothetical protein